MKTHLGFLRRFNVRHIILTAVFLLALAFFSFTVFLNDQAGKEHRDSLQRLDLAQTETTKHGEHVTELFAKEQQIQKQYNDMLLEAETATANIGNLGLTLEQKWQEWQGLEEQINALESEIAALEGELR